MGHDESTFVERIPDGPESGMPQIKVETVVPVAEHVNFASDFQIVDIKDSTDDVTDGDSIVKLEKDQE